LSAPAEPAGQHSGEIGNLVENLARESARPRRTRGLRAASRKIRVVGGCSTALMVMGSCTPVLPPASAGGHSPARCERRLNGLYETLGPATIDKHQDRYVLSFRCDGIHQVYVRIPAALDLEQFVGKSVRARYRYVEQENPRTRCVRAPCPPVLERVLDITGLEEVSGVNAPGK